eukprot:gene14722-19788_t
MNTKNLLIKIRSKYFGTNLIKRSMGGHGHDHGPKMPPFARLQPPTGSIPLNAELVWNDSVAPETCVDFDVVNIPTSRVFLSFACGFGFFAFVMGVVWLSDPVNSNPVALRRDILSSNNIRRDLGLDVDEEDEEHEEEHEDDDE